MKLRSFFQKLTRSFIFTGLIIGATQAHAITLSYWEADNNFDDSVGSVDGTLSKNDGGVTGVVPTYTADVPGAIITAGVGGSVINTSNTHSVSFVNPGLPDITSKAGGKVTIDGDTFHLAAFTIEAFVKTSSLPAFTTLFSFNRDSGSTWMLDTNDTTGTLRIRSDTQGSVGGVSNSNLSSSGADNISITDGAWHHIALSYDGSRFYAYVDYKLVIFDGTGTPGWDVAGDLVYTNADITLGSAGGGRGYNGLMDEVRISNSALTTDEMLRALPVPEPTVAFLSAIGALALLRRKRN